MISAVRTRPPPSRREGVRQDVVETLRIGMPLAAAQLAQMTMGVTDAVMLGTIGPDALAAGGLGTTVEVTTLVILQGVLAAVSALVAQARGAGRESDVAGLYGAGLLLAALLSVPAILLFHFAEPLLLVAGQPPALAEAAGRFLRVLEWCVPGAMLGAGLQRAFLPAIGAGWIIFPVTLAGTIVNGFLCYGLIHGVAGLPALGFIGPAVATAIVTTGVGAALTLFTHAPARRHLVRWTRPSAAIMGQLLRLGVPISATFAVETTLFLAVVLLMGRLGEDALAAQQVALLVISLAFMIPLGISQAANVRVGHAVGAGTIGAARRAGLVAVGLGAVSEIGFAAINLLAPEMVTGFFIAPASAAGRITIDLLGVAALFQIADGVQTVAAGSLRGLGDTRVPFALAAVGYWAIGFPAAAVLALHTTLGPVGAWIGLAAGLGTVAVMLTTRFALRAR